MRRSGGVTFSAVVVFVGCGLILLVVSLDLLALLFVPHIEGQPPMVRNFLIVGILIILAFVGWGIATGVDLLRLKPWARISMMVFCGLLLLASIPGILMFALMPIPLPADADLPDNFLLILRVGVCGFYGLLTAIAGSWLYYFNRKSVREQFQGGAAPDGTTFRSPRRPVSITVIAWFMLIGACLGPLMIWASRSMYPGGKFPFMFLGVFLSGWAAFAVFLCWCAAQLFAAVGLLKLRPWGRMLAIWLQILGLLNAGIVYGIPHNRERFEQILATMQQPYAQAFPTTNFFMWVGVAASLPILVIILWFLITQKQAFLAENAGSAPAL